MDLMQNPLAFLNPDYRNSAAKLHERYGWAAPFPHIVLDNFLDTVFCQQLLESFPGFSEQYAVNEDGRTGGKAVITTLPDLGPAYAQLHTMFQSSEFRQWLSDLSGIPHLLFDPEYFGGGTHENIHGQCLDPHVDFSIHPTTLWYRRLNFLLYLNKDWNPSWGGNLELHSNPRNQKENVKSSVAPLFNRCVIFTTSDRSWHGFPEIHSPEGPQFSRRSIACYFFTREAPATRASRNSTVYVDLPIPSDNRNVNTVKRYLARREQHLDRLLRFEQTRANEIVNQSLKLMHDRSLHLSEDMAHHPDPAVQDRYALLLDRLITQAYERINELEHYRMRQLDAFRVQNFGKSLDDGTKAYD